MASVNAEGSHRNSPPGPPHRDATISSSAGGGAGTGQEVFTQKSNLYTYVADPTGRLHVVWKDVVSSGSGSVPNSPVPEAHNRSSAAAPLHRSPPGTGIGTNSLSPGLGTTTGTPSKSPLIVVSPIKTVNNSSRKHKLGSANHTSASVKAAPGGPALNLPRVVSRRGNKSRPLSPASSLRSIPASDITYNTNSSAPGSPSTTAGSSSSSLSGSFDDTEEGFGDELSGPLAPLSLPRSLADFDNTSISSNLKEMLRRNIADTADSSTSSAPNQSSRLESRRNNSNHNANGSVGGSVHSGSLMSLSRGPPGRPPPAGPPPDSPASNKKSVRFPTNNIPPPPQKPSTPKRAPSEILNSSGSILRTGTPTNNNNHRATAIPSHQKAPKSPNAGAFLGAVVNGSDSFASHAVSSETLKLGRLYFCMLMAGFGLLLVSCFTDFGLAKWYSSNNAAFSVTHSRVFSPFVYPRDPYDNPMLDDPLFSPQALQQRVASGATGGADPLLQLYKQSRKYYGSSFSDDPKSVHMSTSTGDEKLVRALFDLNINEPAYNSVVGSSWAKWTIQGMALQPAPATVDEFFRTEALLRGRRAEELTQTDLNKALTRVLRVSASLNRVELNLPQKAFDLKLDGNVDMKVDLRTYNISAGSHELRISALLECNPDYDKHGYRQLTVSANAYFYYFPRDELPVRPSDHPSETAPAQPAAQTQPEPPKSEPIPRQSRQIGVMEQVAHIQTLDTELDLDPGSESLSAHATVEMLPEGYVSPFNFLSDATSEGVHGNTVGLSSLTMNEKVPILRILEPVQGRSAVTEGRLEVQAEILTKYLLSSKLRLEVTFDRETKVDITPMVRTQVGVDLDIVAAVPFQELALSSNQERGTFVVNINGLAAGNHIFEIAAYETPTVVPIGMTIEEVIGIQSVLIDRVTLEVVSS